MEKLTKPELELRCVEQELALCNISLERDELKKALAAAQQSVEVKQRANDEGSKHLKAAQEQRDTYLDAMHAAQKERGETLEQFEDLKTKLHAAESENLRLQGYIDRVYEDDVAREGFVEVPRTAEPMLQPRRPSAMRAADTGRRDYEAGAQVQSLGYSDRADRRHPRHWVNYGR